MLKDLLIKDRSYRGFNENRKITRKELEELIELTRYCPSSINRQPLVYYLAYEPELVTQIQQNTFWARALKDITLPKKGEYPTAFIVVAQDLNLDANEKLFIRDVGIVAHTILLGAVERGLGGCMIGSFMAEGVRKALNMPENMLPHLVIAIGEPAESIILEDLKESGNVAYYRDENGLHHVPKRELKDILAN